MKILFVHTPFSDPAQAYLSLPYLKGFLNKEGYDSKIIDLNIEGFYYLFSDVFYEKICLGMRDRFKTLDKKSFLGFEEQLEYKGIYKALQIIDCFKNRQKLIDVIKSKELFYDYKEYRQAAEGIDQYFEIINAAFFPYKFGFNRLNHYVLPWSFNLLDGYCREGRSPFNEFYEKYFNAQGDSPDIIGISLTFVSQIAESINLACYLKKKYPDSFIVLGGAAIHQIVCNLDDQEVKKFFKYTDGISIFEGEISMPDLIAQLKSGYKNPLKEIPNFISYDGKNDVLIKGGAVCFNLKDQAMPDYTDLDLDRYLSCGRMLLYAPARGCYWRKCSFCTYGYSGIMPYREIDPDKAAEDLKKLSGMHDVRNFYISCDVLSPSYAVRFASSLINKNTGISWSVDLKIEKYYDEDKIKTLKKSGLVSAAFGIESGSDRVLDIINKGIKSSDMKNISRIFHEAGIAAQWMTFTGHPGENFNDAMRTLDMIEDQHAFIDLFITGDFGLMSGSRIASCPADFGIKSIYYTAGDDLRIFPLYKTSVRGLSDRDKSAVNDKLYELSLKYRLMHYPWAGAISTNHSLLYFIKYGQNIFKDLTKLKISGFKIKYKDIRHSFDINTIDKNESLFYGIIYREALEPAVKKNGLFYARLSGSYLSEIAGGVKKIRKKK